MSDATIINALLRCTREDDLPKSSFELVRADLGIWVCELPDSFHEIIEVLSTIRPLLKTLSKGASDYTLHIAATVDETHRLVIPSSLAALSSDCGFAIEIVSGPEWES